MLGASRPKIHTLTARRQNTQPTPTFVLFKRWRAKGVLCFAPGTGHSPKKKKKRFKRLASVASKINILLSLPTASTKVFQVKTKQRKPNEAGTEPPKLMGPAHSLRAQVGTRVGTQIPQKKNNKRRTAWPQHLFSDKMPLERYRACRCKGRINSLKPEGIFFFFLCLLGGFLGCFGEGFRTGRLVEKHHKLLPARLSLLSVGNVGSGDPAFVPQRAGSRAKTLPANGLRSPGPPAWPDPTSVPKHSPAGNRGLSAFHRV